MQQQPKSVELEQKTLRDGFRNAFYYPNGDVYTGDWKAGVREGKGVLNCKKDGSVYTGEWVSDRKAGFGSLSVLNKKKLVKVYTGLWKDDMFHGTGTYFYQDGSRYEGEWAEQQREGYGRLFFANGDRYEGQWAKNRRNGRGTMFFNNGDRFVGDWKDDMKHGEGEFHHATKKMIYYGRWVNDNAVRGFLESLTGGIELPELKLVDPKRVLEI